MSVCKMRDEADRAHHFRICGCSRTSRMLRECSERLLSPGTRTTLAASSTGITPRGLRRSPWSLSSDRTAPSAPLSSRQVPGTSKSSSQSRLQTDKISPSPKAPQNRRCQSTSALEVAHDQGYTWPAAAQCWKVLELMAPMRAAIEATTEANPARQGTSVAQPEAAEVEKLRQHCAVMTAAVAELQQVLSQDTRRDGGWAKILQWRDQEPTKNSHTPDHKVRACPKAEDRKKFGGAPIRTVSKFPSSLRRAQSYCVEPHSETCQKLKDEVASLEGQGARADDLEEVAASLRRRVAELRAEEAKAAALRNECRELRFQIAELVASVVDGAPSSRAVSSR
ncbi:unnamed protein product [Symbiodinium sp. CCMP2592]|nr:unnamed protein product [Symbiodinium sp. CCMP2592]